MCLDKFGIYDKDHHYCIEQ